MSKVKDYEKLGYKLKIQDLEIQLLKAQVDFDLFSFVAFGFLFLFNFCNSMVNSSVFSGVLAGICLVVFVIEMVFFYKRSSILEEMEYKKKFGIL